MIQSSKWPVKVLLLALIYLVSGKLGLLLAVPPGYATAVWPPSGLALAGVLLLGNRFWPGVWLGSFLVNVSVSLDPSSGPALAKSLTLAACIGLGAALQAVLGSILVRRFAGYPNSLSRAADVSRFLALGGPVACLVNATIGVTTLWLAGAMPSASVPYNWFTWWVGDTIGVLIFTLLALMWAGTDRKSLGQRRWTVTLPLAGTFVAAVLIFLYSSRSEMGNLRREFDEDCRQMVAAVERRLAEHLEAVRTTAGLFESSVSVDRDEFRRFTLPLLERHASLAGVTWIPHVASKDRAVYEATAQREGLGDLRFKEDRDGQIVPVGERAEYYPVFYFEPLLAGRQVLGFDVASEPKRRIAVEAARDTGRTTASSNVRLIQDASATNAFVVYTPVYSNVLTSASSVEDRRKSLHGFVSGVFRTSELLLESIQDLKRAGEIELRVSDTTEAGTSQLLFATARRPGSAQPGPMGLELQTDVSVAGRTWTLHFRPTLGYLALLKSWQTWLVLATGLLFTALTGAGLMVLTGRTDEVNRANAELTTEIGQRLKAEAALRSSEARLEQLVAERTAELAANEILLRQFVQYAPAAIAMLDKEMRYLQISDRWAKDYKLQGHEIIGRCHYDVFPDIPERWKEIHRRVLGGAVEACEEDPFPRADGGMEWLQWEARPWRTVGGEIGGLIFFTQVITARKRTEDKVRQLNAELEAKSKEQAELNEALWRTLGAGSDEGSSAAGSNRLEDADRLAALAQTHLMDTLPEEKFDRFTSLAAESLRVPVCLISLVDDHRQFFKSAVGLPEPWATRRETPLSHSFCQHVVTSGLPLEVTDAREHNLVKQNLAVCDLGVVAYLGVPLTTPQGQTLGSLCAIDGQPRSWTSQDRDTLENIARSLLTEMAVHSRLEELRLSRERLELVVRGAVDGIWDWDVETNEAYFSDRWCELLAYSSEELKPRFETWISHLHPEDKPRATAAIQAHLEKREPYDLEYRLRTKFGEYRWFRASGQARWNEAGKPLRMAGSITDITERKRSEEALRLSEERFRNAVEYSAIGMALVALDGRWLKVNRALCGIVGYSAEELLRRTFQDITHPEDLNADLSKVQDLLAGRITDYHMEKRYFHQDGSVVWVHLSVSLIRHSNGDPLYFVSQIQDVTNRRKAQEDLERAVAELERSNKELEQFAYVASHDLQEPLRAVAGCVQILKTRYQGKLDTKADELIFHVVDGARRMQQLIHDLLDYSKVGRTDGKLRPIDSAAAMKVALLNLDQAITESAADVRFEALPMVLADHNRIVQLLQNLVGNAIKYRGERRPEVTVSATSGPTPGVWTFCVRDNGIGIEPQYHERIFGLFQRLHTRKEYPGTGIGLAICRKIVETFGGDMRVESVPGEGSSFFFTLQGVPGSRGPGEGRR